MIAAPARYGDAVSTDPAFVRPGTVLEPAVAALEAALHMLRKATSIDAEARRLAEQALEDAHSRLIQQWFGDTTGQDSLFDDPSVIS